MDVTNCAPLTSPLDLHDPSCLNKIQWYGFPSKSCFG